MEKLMSGFTRQYELWRHISPVSNDTYTDVGIYFLHPNLTLPRLLTLFHW
jgi:hypothetical protein